MFTLTFKTENDAFKDEHNPVACALECARILKIVTRRLVQGQTGGTVVDNNGQKVGQFSLTPRD